MARLTDLAIRNLKASTKRQEIPDQQQRGLYVVVQPTGSKVFAVRYRYNGRPRKLTLQPGIGLAEARKEAAEALYQVQRGTDPAEAKIRTQEEKRAAEADTLEAIAAEFFKREGPKLRTTKKWESTLRRLVLPKFGKRPIASLRRKEITRLLDQIEDDNGLAQADATLAIVRRIANWHAARDDDFLSPFVRGMTRRKPKEHARKRILNDAELRAVWKAAEATPGPFGHFVHFLLLTACRRNEAAHLPWSEIIDGDWLLPAARAKTKEDTPRPLSAAALAVLSKVPRIADSPFAFSSDGRRLGGMDRRKVELDKASGVSGWTLHDLRRTASSLMARAQVPERHAEKCLGHAIPGVKGIYNRYPYRDEMLIAYEKLATLIASIVDPQPNVVTMVRS
jgi:integrase